jgi:hypothetical protein
MKKALFILAIVIASANVSFAQRVAGGISIDVIIGNRAPAPNEVNLMRAEEARHPNIAKSMHDLEDAMKHLHEAPNDFGGHKAQAEADLKQAWISLRKALYFRLYQDTH